MVKKGNMKGFLFTLDAVFALVIAAVGVTIILYIDFVSPGSFAAPVAQAYSVLQSMLQITLGASSSGSIYIGSLAAYANSSSASWPQFGHDSMLSSSSSFSQQTPYLLYTYSAPANILPTVVLENGYAFVSSGKSIYLINATNGKLESTIAMASPAKVVGVPAVYRNVVYYANSTGSINAFNMPSMQLQWSFNAVNSITTPLEIENNFLTFGTTKGFYLINTVNGTIAAYAALPTQIEDVAFSNGEYLVTTTSQGTLNFLYSYILNSGSLVNIWKEQLSTSPTTSPSILNNTVGVGSGDVFYIYNLSGTPVVQTSDLGSQVLGVASYRNQYYVQTATNLYSFIYTGNVLASRILPTTAHNTTPSLASSTLYTLAGSHYFQGYDSNLKNMLWNISLPTSHVGGSNFTSIALAYGNIYVPSGNTLYVFGTYRPQANDNLLQTIANLYINRQGGYASLIFGKFYNSTSSGIFINNTYAPDLSVPTFNSLADSYINQADGFSWMNSANQKFSISIWVDPSSSNGVIVDEVTAQQPGSSAWHASMLELYNGNVFMRVWNQPCKNIGLIPVGKWSNIVMTFNGTQTDGYINGELGGVQVGTKTVPGGSSLMYYPLGVGDSANCGSGAYFSGSMLDYQLYNVTLGKEQIAESYQNGAFALPNDTYSDLSLWFPLQGSPNDFSGSINPGFQYGITYAKSNYIPQRFMNSYEVSKASVPIELNVNGSIARYNVSVVLWR